ncbi:MAG: TerD family protein [Synergistaceae bacterium]|jgi:stress response protein SCP2|nr:TerD family protein [Synergistaceae bacterium]
MSVNLQKGQKVDLTKGNAGLKKLMIGLGWDEAGAESQKKGFLGGLLGGKKQADIDCDASALLLSGGKLAGVEDVVYFGNLSHASGAVRHQGDNLTGGGEGDDEQILINLKEVPAKFDKIMFVVNIYKAADRQQHFGMIRNAFIRVVNADNQQELCKYNLSENYDGMTAMIFGEVYRHNEEWKFNAIGQATKDKGISELAQRYR